MDNINNNTKKRWRKLTKKDRVAMAQAPRKSKKPKVGGQK